eukprot:gnl/MRDRNA2_/MRDRNA2_71201_c0_seq1.p1 gnl/MRDRNA2_/MRDRNA2_71201_c0~~gnl/MRDRNA2_/MRDRNA2_71201_c0_seq1.p1  ORF type:complete len:703 (-),score=168.19 gnl/MRDRNA2_/MRDRNA2_71201_c0_seq1:89-2197(-)
MKQKLGVHFCIFQADTYGIRGWTRDFGDRSRRWDVLLDSMLLCVSNDGHWPEEVQVSTFVGGDVVTVDGRIQDLVMPPWCQQADGRKRHTPATNVRWGQTLWEHCGDNTHAGLQWRLFDSCIGSWEEARAAIIQNLKVEIQELSDSVVLVLDAKNCDISYEALKSAAPDKCPLRTKQVYVLLGGAHGFDGRDDHDGFFLNEVTSWFRKCVGEEFVFRVNLNDEVEDCCKFTANKVASFMSVEWSRGALCRAVAGAEALAAKQGKAKVVEEISTSSGSTANSCSCLAWLDGRMEEASTSQVAHVPWPEWKDFLKQQEEPLMEAQETGSNSLNQQRHSRHSSDETCDDVESVNGTELEKHDFCVEMVQEGEHEPKGEMGVQNSPTSWPQRKDIVDDGEKVEAQEPETKDEVVARVDQTSKPEWKDIVQEQKTSQNTISVDKDNSPGNQQKYRSQCVTDESCAELQNETECKLFPVEIGLMIGCLAQQGQSRLSRHGFSDEKQMPHKITDNNTQPDVHHRAEAQEQGLCNDTLEDPRGKTSTEAAMLGAKLVLKLRPKANPKKSTKVVKQLKDAKLQPIGSAKYCELLTAELAAKVQIPRQQASTSSDDWPGSNWSRQTWDWQVSSENAKTSNTTWKAEPESGSPWMPGKDQWTIPESSQKEMSASYRKKQDDGWATGWHDMKTRTGVWDDSWMYGGDTWATWSH